MSEFDDVDDNDDLDWKPKRMVVLEFPNMTTLKKWYNSADYQNIIKDRTDNSIGNMVFVEGY